MVKPAEGMTMEELKQALLEAGVEEAETHELSGGYCSVILSGKQQASLLQRGIEVDVLPLQAITHKYL